MSSDGPKLTILGKLVIFAIVAASLYGAYILIAKDKKLISTDGVNLPFSSGEEVTIGIAYGTEKERWLKWANEEFEKTKDGKRIKVNLIPMGSLEGAQAIIKKDERITIWSPASALYKDVFVEEWKVKYATEPISKEESLALSPMVFVMWEERYKAFVNKYGSVNFSTISKALREPGGWSSIASKPEWGLFKFGHTHPNESNSGLMALVLMAYDYHNKTSDLTLGDIVDVNFQEWMQKTERAVSGLSNSTGNMMKEMVLKGPSSFDALLVYESVVIDYLKNAEGRWGTLYVVYPNKNIWNDNPYYIIDAEWVTKEQNTAAEKFLDFLMSEEIQKQALTHGFRPGNPSVPVKFADSPFVVYQKYGMKIDLPTMCEPPKAEAINNLLQSWQRGQDSR